jgi:hypothetical protein
MESAQMHGADQAGVLDIRSSFQHVKGAGYHGKTVFRVFVRFNRDVPT